MIQYNSFCRLFVGFTGHIRGVFLKLKDAKSTAFELNINTLTQYLEICLSYS
jgi:hypothetical protein